MIPQNLPTRISKESIQIFLVLPRHALPEKQQQPYSGSSLQKKRSLMRMRGVYCVCFVVAFCLRRCDGGDWLCQPLCRDGNVQPLFMQMVRLGFHRLPPPLPLPLLSLLVLLILVLVLRLSGWLCLADLQAGHTGRSGLAVSDHRARSI